MSDPTGPIDAVADRRAKERRASERRKPSACTALIVCPPPPTPTPEASEPIAEAAFTAQVLGQSGQKRGLKAAHRCSNRQDRPISTPPIPAPPTAGRLPAG